MKKLAKLIVAGTAAWLFSANAFAQNAADVTKLPVNIVNAGSDTSKPFILYISGDGGWNKFSQNLTQALAQKGYPVVSLNANKYFWQKKTPEQASSDVSNLITIYKKQFNRKRAILLGYSFGADVMPFIFNRLPKETSSLVGNITLISPSPKTDFEIHVLEMLGNKGTGQSVPDELNKITSKTIILISGENENDFPLAELRIKNFQSVKLPGGHHFDDNESTVCNTIVQHIPAR